VSRSVPHRARTLAAELALRFAQDAQLATRLNEAHQRLQRANERLWRGVHPDGMAAVYGEHPAAVEAAVRGNQSQALGARDPRQALQQAHWQIHRAHRDYQNVAEDRRRLAASIGEIVGAFVDELVAAGWSEREARNAKISELADRGGDCPHDPGPRVADGEGSCGQNLETRS
jgi:hypothetical protein